MKGELFTHEVSKTSSVFGRKESVNVVFQGENAATDGTNIILPTIDLTGDVSDKTADVIRGYVDHEAGHIRHTDFEALKVFGDECQRTGNRLLRAIHNALEDVWLERRVIDEYPGAERNLVATSDAVNQEFLNNVPEGDPRLQDDEFITAVALTWEGRKNYGGKTCDKCLGLLDSELRNALEKWVHAIGACQNTSDVITLAKEIERQLKAGEHREQPEETEDGKSGSREGDEDADTDGGVEMRSDDEGSSGDESEGDATSVDNDAGDADTDGRGVEDSEDESSESEGKANTLIEENGGIGASGDESEGSEKPEVYEDFDLSSVVEEVIKADGLIEQSEHKYRPMTTAHDKWHHRTDDEDKYDKYTFGTIMKKGTRQEYDRYLERSSGATNVMRRKLERALMAKQSRGWNSGHEHGRLDSRRLSSAYSGMPNVFKMREEIKDMDTALTMLVDMSGSMDYDSRHILATLTTISMCEAIDRTGINYEVLGFNNRSHWIKGVPRVDPYIRDESGHKTYNEDGECVMNRYHRTTPLDMYIFKAFEERLNEAKGALSKLANLVTGQNSDGEAVQNAFDRLRQRPEKRKIMIVFSDGHPISDSHYDKNVFEDHLYDVVRDISKAGVDVIGVGICDRSVSRFYPKYVIVNNVQDLAGSAMDMLAKSLMGESFVVDNSKIMDAS